MPKPRNLITDEIATSEKDIYQDYVGKTLLNPDKILKTESYSRGVELYEDLLRDDKVGSTLQTRKLAVVGKEWEIIPASEKRRDQKIADYVKEVLTHCNYDAARQSLLSGIVIGFKPAEIMWEYSEGQVWIKEIIGRAAHRFVFGRDRNLRLRTMSNMVYGEELPEKKFLVFTNASDIGSPYGDGIGRMLYWPVWFKKNAIKFWMVFAEKFGSPTVVGKYPPGTAKVQQDKLLSVLEAIQQESAITMPDNIVVELLEATRGGSGDNYEALCKYMNGAIAQVMLGQTLTSEIAGTGTYAASKTHEEVRQDYIKADADALCEIQNNTLIRWIVDYNFPGVKQYPKVWIRTAPEKDLKPLADRDKVLSVDIGLPMTKNYFYDTYGIPEPEEGEEIVEVGETRDDGREDTEEDEGPKKKTTQFAEKDWIATYMERIAPTLQAARSSAMDSIEEWLRSLDVPPGEEQFISRIERILGTSLSATDTAVITKTVRDMYKAFRAIPGAEIRFGGPDLRSMEFLGKLDRFYVSKWITNPDAQAAVKDFLKRHYLEDGHNLYKRGAPESINAFRELFSRHLADLEDWQIQRIVDTSVTRVQNWAVVNQLHEAGIMEMEIYEPTQDCSFCKAINGTIISVPVAYRTMQRHVVMTPLEYEDELKRTIPVEENITSLVEQGALPPYHPHCHGVVITRVT